MCGFCGLMLGADHWSEMRKAPPEQGDHSSQGSRQRERLHCIALLNRITRHYGIAVRDWEGTSWIVSHATGETAVIDRLADLWPTVESLARRRCDPLSPALIASLESRAP